MLSRRPKAGRPAGGCLTIADLPDEVLTDRVLVGLHRQSSANRAALPAVCRRWHRLLRSSALLWSSLTLDVEPLATNTDYFSGAGRSRALRQGLAWDGLLAHLQSKAGITQNLRILRGYLVDEGSMRELLSEALSPLLASRELTALSLSGVYGTLMVRAAASAPGLRRLALSGAPFIEGRRKEYNLVFEDLEAIAALTQLEELRIDYAKVFQRLRGHRKLWAMPHLTSLRLCCNADLTTLPSAMSGLSALKQLELAALTVGALPHTATSLTALTSVKVQGVHLRHNRGLGFVQTLDLLPNLRSVELVRVGLRDFPRQLLLAAHLQELKLEEVRWGPYVAIPQRLLPPSWSKLSSLEWSYMETAMPPGWCQALTSLKRLTIKVNSKPWVHPRLINKLRSLPRLESLLLNGTGIRAEDDDFWDELRHMTQLTELGLSWTSNMRELADGPYLENLQALDLSKNDFRDLPPALQRASALRRLDLGQNSRLRLSAASVRSMAPAWRHLTWLSLQGRYGAGPPQEAIERSSWRDIEGLKELADLKPQLQVELTDSNPLKGQNEGWQDVVGLSWVGLGPPPAPRTQAVLLGALQFPDPSNCSLYSEELWGSDDERHYGFIMDSGSESGESEEDSDGEESEEDSGEDSEGDSGGDSGLGSGVRSGVWTDEDDAEEEPPWEWDGNDWRDWEEGEGERREEQEEGEEEGEEDKRGGGGHWR